ncbi:hypothetical protein SAMN02745687_01815 [Lachnospiraceae bacterium NK3A20]|jgi:hypothetical protein|nr:hypothetical protein SAMN02745687_01815 [Lachnospiraceae bacterium NK3A20]
MLTAVKGHYDGTKIVMDENLKLMTGQKLIITILNDFGEADATAARHGLRGSLSKYANPKLQEKEQSAWESAVIEKYGNA